MIEILTSTRMVKNQLFSIDETRLNAIVRPQAMKQTDGLQVPDVSEAYKLMVWNMHDITSKFKAYNMVQWIKNIDHWSSTYGQRYTTAYSRGEILMVDLGAMNYGYEFSYPHPSVVIYETLDMVFIVPGSSKKFGTGQRGIINATSVNDGFDKDTGLLLYNMRWIHKNRIKHSTGRQTSPRVLKEVEQFILQLNHEYHQGVQVRAQSSRRLRTNIYHLHQQIQQQAQAIQKKDQDIQQKTKEIEKRDRKIQSQEKRIKMYEQQLRTVRELIETLKAQGHEDVSQKFLDTFAEKGLMDASNE